MVFAKFLLLFSQGLCQVAKYALEFCTLTAGRDWNKPALNVAF